MMTIRGLGAVCVLLFVSSTQVGNASSPLSLQCATLLATNPLLAPSPLPFGAIPYDQIKAEHVEPAFRFAMREASAQLRAIRSNPDAPSFANTIEALEMADRRLDQVWNIFYHLQSTSSTDELLELEGRLDPQLSKFNTAILLDSVLLNRVNSVFAQQASLGLNPEQATLLKKWFQAFQDNGANLQADQKQKLAALQAQITVLSNQYKANLLKENSRLFLVSDRARLKGIPANDLAAAAKLAQTNGHPGQWAFTPKATSVAPALRNAEDRSLREEIWRFTTTVAAHGPTDNRPLALQIAQLMQESARLLGHATYADSVLRDRMAGNLQTVENFLTRLGNAYRPVAIAELKELQTLAGHVIEPWDSAFYTQKLRQMKFGFSVDDLRPYLPLDQVLKGAIVAVERRYGVRFVARTDIPVWHPSVQAFEVQDAASSEHLGLYYFDPFPRDSKKQGAWNFAVMPASKVNGNSVRPHVVNILNITAPQNGEPALLLLDEVRTIYHELGHSVHNLFTRAHYPSLAGSRVTRDFVELPSQMNERWLEDPTHLATYARHYKTGQVIPQSLIKQIQDAAQFQVGMQGLGQVSLGMLDLAWHARDLSHLKTPADVEAWEQQAVSPFRVLAPYPGAIKSTTFAHIFAGGYSASYYSYKWADVLAADAFSVFQASGIFDLATAERFKREILEKGGTESADILYRRFKGSDPDPDALLREEGIIP